VDNITALVQERKRNRKERKRWGSVYGICVRMPRLIQRPAIKIRTPSHQSSLIFEKHISDLVLHLALGC